MSCFPHGSFSYLPLPGIIAWDTIIIFSKNSPAAPLLPRKFRRSQSFHLYNNGFLRVYPCRWMILSCLILSPTMLPLLSFTYGRMHTLHDLVGISCPVLLQYHLIRFSEWRSLIRLISVSICDDSDMSSVTASFTSDNISLAASINLCTTHSLSLDQHFQSQKWKENVYISIFWIAWTGVSPSLPSPFDLLELDELCPLETFVYACHPLNSIDFDECPSLAAWHSIWDPVSVSMGSFDLFSVTAAMGHKFPLIFDSGASLAISPDAKDFVGPITPFATERRLGGIAQGMLIAGTGTSNGPSQPLPIDALGFILKCIIFQAVMIILSVLNGSFIKSME